MKSVLLGNRPDDEFLGGFLKLSSKEKLVQDVVGLVKVEDEIEFTDVAKVAVKDLHKVVNHLQGDQLVVVHVHADDEEERGVSLVNDLVLFPLDEVTVLHRAVDDQRAHLPDDLGSLLLRLGRIPLGQAGAPLSAHQQKPLKH